MLCRARTDSGVVATVASHRDRELRQTGKRSNVANDRNGRNSSHASIEAFVRAERAPSFSEPTLPQDSPVAARTDTAATSG